MFSTTGGDDEHKGVLTTTTNIEDEKIHETDVLISDLIVGFWIATKVHGCLWAPDGAVEAV